VNSTLEQAWSKIEVNRQRSVIVVKGKKIVGTLSDGDIRKAIMSKRLLSTPIHEIMNTNFISLPLARKKEAVAIFKKMDIFLLPVVSDNLQLLDVLVRGSTRHE
jgi:CBS domain-containing protein